MHGTGKLNNTLNQYSSGYRFFIHDSKLEFWNSSLNIFKLPITNVNEIINYDGDVVEPIRIYFDKLTPKQKSVNSAPYNQTWTYYHYEVDPDDGPGYSATDILYPHIDGISSLAGNSTDGIINKIFFSNPGYMTIAYNPGLWNYKDITLDTENRYDLQTVSDFWNYIKEYTGFTLSDSDEELVASYNNTPIILQPRTLVNYVGNLITAKK